MKKGLSLLLLLTLLIPQTIALNLYKWTPYKYDWITDEELYQIRKTITTLWDNRCENYRTSDIPTIFIPWILASWYSEEWYKESWTQTKRWIPDPITNSYDTLFYTFKKNWYTLRDVYYEDEHNIKIDTWLQSSPKNSLYLFWYDWKKDNKITATLLSQLIWKILKNYEKQEWCNIEKVNIISHSMWWLVARTLLEDMCADYTMNWDKLQINLKKTKSWQLPTIPTKKCINPYPSPSLWTQIKINKLITISTPHRGSPRSLPLWERWDMNQIEKLSISISLKLQFWDITNQQLYQTIHWHNKKNPNWIITIWQLLPDIQNYNNYNEYLEYLNKENTQLTKQNYPKNSYLEELNKEENINKMWDKITDKYISYYSTQTWNHEKNNIIWFKLNTNHTWKKYHYDKTENITWKDIYDNYPQIYKYTSYNTKESIRNQDWLWWDWTVPTLNLFLVPNDNPNWKQIEHPKFESIEMKCYSTKIPQRITNDLMRKTGENSYTKNLYRWLWTDSHLEICSHSKTPIWLSVRVFEDISGKDITQWKTQEDEIKQERTHLLKNIWYANYFLDDYEWLFWYSKIWWIHNYTKLDRIFKKDKNSDYILYWYHPVIKDKDIDKELENLEFGVEPYDKTELSLDFWNSKWWVFRYEILSPINILLEDEQWRRIWIDPETGLIINEIPWAWTSWNTEWSWEPEFFLIPQTWTWKTQHKIKTYGTGEGRYDIVMEEITPFLNSTITEDEIEQPSKKEKLLIITWQARESFWEDYEIEIDKEQWTSYTNLTKEIPATLEVKNRKYKIESEDFTLRYSIRWKSEEVEKIKYILYNGKMVKLDENIEKITWRLNLNITKNWKYILKIELLGKENTLLKNQESKQEIEIEKIYKQENFIKQALKSSKNNKQKQSYKTNFPQRFITNEMLENYKNNQPQINKSILNLLKQENTLAFQLYTTQNKTTTLWYWLTHNYYTQFYYDKKNWEIEVQLPSWKLNKFIQDINFEYTQKLENNLEAQEELNYIKIIDKHENKNYYFSKQTQKLEKIETHNWKIELTYNYDWTLKKMIKKEKAYNFNYDDTKLLKQITNENNQKLFNFEYEKIWEISILKSINDIEIIYNQEWELINTEEIEDKLKKYIKTLEKQRQIEKFEKDYKLQKKLNKIREKIDTKFTKKQKQKLLNYIKKNKNRYITKAKTGKKIFYEYIFDKVEYYLNT